MADRSRNQLGFLASLKITSIFSPCLREEEQGDAFSAVFDEILDLLDKVKQERPPKWPPPPSQN